MNSKINLTEMDLIPLNHTEEKQINGGIWPYVARAVYFVAGAIAGNLADRAIDPYIDKMLAPGKVGPNRHNACDNV